MTASTLEVRDLRVEIPARRGLVRAVDGVSFDVRPGEILGLVGESGCGKTTTLRSLIGLLPREARITGGQVFFEGQDLLALTAGALGRVRGRSIGMVFQDPMSALNPIMRVGDQIAEGPRHVLGVGRREARLKAIELLREVGIPDPERRANAYPHELSGGMRQRVMIAIAMSCRPQVILCDEPTTALDVTIQDQILKLLLVERERINASLIYVTHDLAVVAEICTRLAVMYAGQVVEEGPVSEIFARPRHPYTLGLLDSVPDLELRRGALEPIPGAPPDLAAPQSGCRFRSRCKFARAECASGAFPLRPLGTSRSTACIRNEELADLASPLGVAHYD